MEGSKGKEDFEMKTFTSALEMVTWLMKHEDEILKDGYGRQWTYGNFSFFFKDIGKNSVFHYGTDCLHLFDTVINPDLL